MVTGDFLAKMLDVQKIDGVENPANVCTKHVTRFDLVKQLFETTVLHLVCIAAVYRELICTAFLSGLCRWALMSGAKAGAKDFQLSSPNSGDASSSTSQGSERPLCRIQGSTKASTTWSPTKMMVPNEDDER